MMTRAEIFDYVVDKYTMFDILEKLEPYITMDDFMDGMGDTIMDHFYMAFEEDVEEYYDE